MYAAAVGSVELLDYVTTCGELGGGGCGDAATQVSDAFTQLGMADSQFAHGQVVGNAYLDTVDTLSTVYSAIACIASRYGHVNVLTWIMEDNVELSQIGGPFSVDFKPSVRAAIKHGQVASLEWLSSALGNFWAMSASALKTLLPTPAFEHLVRKGHQSMAIWYLNHAYRTVAATKREATFGTLLACVQVSARDVLAQMDETCHDTFAALLTHAENRKNVLVPLVRSHNKDMLAYWTRTFGTTGMDIHDVLMEAARQGWVEVLARANPQRVQNRILYTASACGQVAVLEWSAHKPRAQLEASALAFSHTKVGNVAYRIQWVLNWWERNGQGATVSPVRVNVDTLVNLARGGLVLALDAIHCKGFLPALGEEAQLRVIKVAVEAARYAVIVLEWMWLHGLWLDGAMDMILVLVTTGDQLDVLDWCLGAFDMGEHFDLPGNVQADIRAHVQQFPLRASSRWWLRRFPGHAKSS